MKLAYTIPNIDQLTLEELEGYLKILKTIGYDGAETSICYADKVEREKVKELLDKYGLKLSGLRSGGNYDTCGVRFSSPEPKVREKAKELLKKVIDLAGYFQCDVLLGRIQGIVPKEEDLAAAKGYIAECLRECSEYAGQYQIDIDYEPINRYEMNYNHTTREMIAYTNEINKPIGHKVKLLMDIFHMMLEDDSIAGAFIRSRELLGHVHFADSNRGVPGTGTIDFKDALDVLDALGYEGWVALEVGMDFCDYTWGAQASYTYLTTILDFCRHAK